MLGTLILVAGVANINHRGCGDAQYPPTMMLALLIYSYSSGVFSSRGIELSTYDSVATRVLCGDTHPDHDTICAFRRKNGILLEKAFSHVLELAARVGVMKVGPEQARRGGSGGQQGGAKRDGGQRGETETARRTKETAGHQRGYPRQFRRRPPVRPVIRRPEGALIEDRTMMPLPTQPRRRRRTDFRTAWRPLRSFQRHLSAGLRRQCGRNTKIPDSPSGFRDDRAWGVAAAGGDQPPVFSTVTARRFCAQQLS